MRRQRPVHHRDVVGAHPAGDADLLVVLQQAVIELAVGVDVALQGIVADAARAHVQRAGLGGVELAGEALFLAHRGVVLRLQGVFDRANLQLDLTVGFVDLRFRGHHLRIAGLIGL